MRVPGAELQKKGTDSFTITSVMCMYTAISKYAWDRVGGVGASALNFPSESDEQKAKHFDKG